MRIVFSLFLAMCFPFILFAQSANEIPFQLMESGHILVKAKVDGVEGNFIFDTGAGLTAFTKTFFDKLKHVVREDGGYTGFRATGERMDLDLYKVKQFQLGSLIHEEEEISYVDANLGGIDGIISLKYMESQPFTIDFEKKVLRLETPKTLAQIREKATSIPVQLEQSRNKSLALFSYFRVNDTLTLQVSFDSGAGKDVYRLNSKYMKALQIDPSDTAHVRTIERKSEFNEQFKSHIYLAAVKKIASEKAPAIQRANVRAQFVDGLIYDGIIWINWLGSKISFDLQHQQLLVQ
ncbi:aspartyl protease [Chitinophaga dinghuensis]|uniref:Aspartyl protease n=1 Tax=Chitinophaga dinghuensis TaxID=1539050 RepID=A0A327VXY3_9BACT|nr:retropepsin-like aspartic protease [Chitinophaga dinghuensis]RAJ80372.1 aspartyl protease [Chitinophaga dinghuensis]